MKCWVILKCSRNRVAANVMCRRGNKTKVVMLMVDVSGAAKILIDSLVNKQ